MYDDHKVLMRTDEITVKVARAGAASQEVEIAEGSTVADALSAAGLSLSSTEKAYVDGTEAKDHYEVEDGDSIVIVGKVEGGR